MKKAFVMLLLAAIGVWGYVVVRVVAALSVVEASRKTDGDAALALASVQLRVTAPLDTSYRDPFQSYLYAQKPAPAAPKEGLVPKHSAPPPEPPIAVLDGILWGDNPVAILKQDGKTELVKVGAEVWDLKVLKIEKNQVTVPKRGRKYTLGM